MIENLVLSLVVSLFLTLALEGLFALAWGVRGWKRYLVLFLCNTLTNPPVVLTCFFFGSLPLKIVLEAAVVLIEGLVYRSCTDLPRPFVFALCCNAFSCLAGEVLNIIL